MTSPRIWLLALGLLLARPSAGEPVVGPRFAPGTVTSCSSYCSRRCYADPPSARACATKCVTATFTGTTYFLGGTQDDHRDCSEQLVMPQGALDDCSLRRGSSRAPSTTTSPF